MKNEEYLDIKEFLENRIYPEFGQQPPLFRYWDTQALRILYVDFLKPNYHYLRNNPRLFQLIEDVQQLLEYE